MTKSRMKAKVFKPEALKRYLSNLELADRRRQERVDIIKRKLETLLRRERELRGQIDTIIAEVNQMRRRRHRAIGVSWSIDRRRIETSYTQPVGPVWFQVIHGRNGSRHLKRIPRVTLKRIKESYQGRDAGLLKRAFKQMSLLAAERDRLLASLDRVVKNLRYVEV